ncbi:MAG: LamG-like jellyroll fold domain-containing protein [Planctomycetota bacterium]
MSGIARTPRLVLAVVLSAASVACGGQGTAIHEKTLVAWVYLENTTQRGGSALTLIDGEEHFDAIVFGEKTPGKWMAGSDFFRRTQDDQSSYPVETADRETPVAVAVVYEKKTVTVYRSGKRYAQYPIHEPQTFDEDAFVLVGLRYVGHMGEIGFLAGRIEEARIYDVALDAGAVASLRPNQPSDPKPLAQWTFEDGAASDAMHHYPQSVLHGGARIADGRLHLDGVDSYLEAFRPRPLGVQAMFYRPRSRQTGRMWDTWLYLHEGTYYLYYLANRQARWDNVSLATSPDGVHWQERGPVLSKRDDAVWMGTGSTWRSPNHPTDGKFFLNFSEWRGPRQTIFFAESSDLAQWKRLGDQYEFKQDTRWYELNGRWDCIYTIPRPGGGLYGYWTATPKPETGGRFGFGQTLDGVTWEALPPPKTPGVGEGGGRGRRADRPAVLHDVRHRGDHGHAGCRQARGSLSSGREKLSPSLRPHVFLAVLSHGGRRAGQPPRDRPRRLGPLRPFEVDHRRRRRHAAARLVERQRATQGRFV